jgi:prolyl-tRNA editing enzyme YbaK/EbsC (Cys-tRNA(Pro) deacylase)
MSVEKVKNYLEQYGASDHVMVFEQSCATVELTAIAVGCEPARIAKTLSFDVNGRAILIVASGDVKIDNAKYENARAG